MTDEDARVSHGNTIMRVLVLFRSFTLGAGGDSPDAKTNRSNIVLFCLTE
jgi:hypothetical protein